MTAHPVTIYSRPATARGAISEAVVFVPIVGGRLDFRGAVPLVATRQAR